MKFNIAVKEFFSVVTKLQGVIDRKSTMPLLSNLLISAEEQSIIVTGTDLGIGIKIQCEADVISQGKITLSARKLYEILKEIPDGTLSLEVDANNWVKINCQNSKFRMASLPADNYPVLTDFSGEPLYTLDRELLREMISKTEYAISQENSRVVFTGVQFVKTDDQLKMTATDGHRLAIIKRAHQEDIPQFDFIIPRKTCRELLNLIDEAADKVSFSWTESKVMFQFGKTQLVSHLVDGKYPNMEKAIPQIEEMVMSFNRYAMISAVKRNAVFSDAVSFAIRFDIDKDRLTISSNDPELGEAKEELEVSFEGPAMTIGFNSKYILEILNVLKSEDVVMKFTDATSSTLIVDPEDNDYLCLIMPMRL